MIEIRPCRLDECAEVLALWERAGALPSRTDRLEEAAPSSSRSSKAPSSAA